MKYLLVAATVTAAVWLATPAWADPFSGMFNMAAGEIVPTCVGDCDNSGAVTVDERGAFDMVGNLEEWVADWVPLSTECPDWGGFSNDRMCLAGASTAVGGPGALTRGGSFIDGTNAGPLTVLGGRRPSATFSFIGFRCVR